MAGSFSRGSAAYFIKETRAAKKAPTITPERTRVNVDDVP
jgi:hypothetical protein